jgi:Flp pilus assembly protein TadD
MPKGPVSDVTHAVYTDHSIPRNIVTAVHKPGAPARSLTLFGGGTPSDRDLGLAYALVAERERNPVYEARALELLEAAVGQRPQDVPAMVQLAHLYGSRGQEEQATRLYETAVASDPEQVVAANNLATYRMRRGRIHDAIALWSQVVARSPGFEAARMNLAVAQSGAGDTKSAEETVGKGIELNPGSTALRKLLREVRAAAAR